MKPDRVWNPDNVLRFVDECYDQDSGAYSSAPGNHNSLYATCYAVMLKGFLGRELSIDPKTIRFIADCQDRISGLFIGPEIRTWAPLEGSKHDMQHLLLHLTCTVLPVLQEYGMQPKHHLRSAHRFCNQSFLDRWLNQRDLHDAWLEGNNFLFAGQLLVFLRDVEKHPKAQAALDRYFHWLDNHIDPATGLWGTDGYCSRFVAMCGGYHQLLVYYHENQPVCYRERLVDTVLSLQHRDGGFSPAGGGGACEDADATDILVNMYKRIDFRRADIRYALRRCLRLLLNLQNPDGGFPYKRGASFSHMSIPATASPPGASNMFSSWFRVNTLALIAQVLTDAESLNNIEFRFNTALSMGWHREWDKSQHQIHRNDRRAEHIVSLKTTPTYLCQSSIQLIGSVFRHVKRKTGR
jgi:hypothetical protein